MNISVKNKVWKFNRISRTRAYNFRHRVVRISISALKASSYIPIHTPMIFCPELSIKKSVTG